MLNIILVDDETFIIKSMLNSIPWESLNVKVVGTFSNSIDALEFIKTHPVDLIITDIRMPGLSGLDLCDYVFNHFPHIQLIIISGYADFTYAQKAIKYNVLGYCIKPLDYGEITTLLRKGIMNTSKLNQSSYDIIDALENQDLDFLTSYFQEKHLNSEKVHIMVSIGALLPLYNIASNYVTIKFGANKYIYLSNEPFNELYLTNALLSDSKVKGIGLYPTPVTLETFKQTLRQTIIMAYQFFFFEAPYLCTTIPSNHHHFLTDLKKILTTRNLPDIKLALSKINNPSQFSNYNIYFALKVWNLSMTYITDYTQLDLEDYYIHNLEELYQKFNHFSTMITTLSDMLLEESIPVELPSTHNNTFIYILQFINGNYMNNISLSDIASNFNLNQSYISQLFRKETGSTYTDYICQLRIQKAKQLLLNSDLSLNDISEKVGYNDYFYFLKSFKKYSGISPGKYRAMGGVCSN